MRLFFGLTLPPDIRAYTARCAEKAAAWIPGRYALADNHHLTLAFLGEVAPERLGDAQAVLTRCAGAFPAPHIRIGGLHVFGRQENGILVLRAQSEPALEPLHEALCAALREADLPADPGPFSPHVTLARHACATEQAMRAAGIDGGAAFTAGQAHLFLSARDEANVLRYTPLASAAFDGNSK